MQSASFGNFQVGIVDNPSIEDQGGFEFSAGMDIFSEPGVLKACNKMVEASYGASAQPADTPVEMVEVDHAGTLRAYMIAGTKLLEATAVDSWSLFRTNGQGANLGLGVFNGHVFYAAESKLGRAEIGDSGTANDSFETLESDADYHPIVAQGGTLKIGAGRYISSLDEAFALTSQALKLPEGYRAMTLAEYFTKLYVGTRRGTNSTISVQDATVFSWPGTVLSSGAALPDSVIPMRHRGMNALLADGASLFGFPDESHQFMIYDGATFKEFRNLIRFLSLFSLRVRRGAVAQHQGTVLFGGASIPQVWQMKDGVICGAHVPSIATPGALTSYDIGVIKSSFNGRVIIGYKDDSSGYHIEYSHINQKQNNAVMRTLWHRVKTDKKKRWAGIKLNLKPLAANVSVTAAYRTDRTTGAAFTNVGTIDSSNQDKPLLLAVQPRSREIQFQLTYTTSTTQTPELLSYDVLHEVLKTSH
jgi:hypothetical protein